MMESLPPRVVALLDCAVTGARRGGADWNEIWDGARGCGVGPTLLAALMTGVISPKKCGTSEADIQKLWSEYSVRQTVKMRLLEHTVGTVKRIFDGDKLPFILLKGGPMTVRLMKNALYRDSNDVDVWVPETCRVRAESLLSEQGYVRAVEPHEWASNQVLLAHEILAPVEVHWALAPPPMCPLPFGACYSRAERDSTRDGCAVLGMEDLWVHLLFHAMDHLFALKTLLDLAAFCDLENEKRNVFHHRAETCGMGRLSAAVYDAVTYFDDDPVLEWGRVGGCADVLRLWIRDMFLRRHQRGRLVIGEDSALEAARGVLMRAGSMFLLDGIEYPVRSALSVLFHGPHRVGAAGERLRRALGSIFSDSHQSFS